VFVPDDLAAPLTRVTADAPCQLESSALPIAGGEIRVTVDGEQTGTCVVHATLADGTALMARLSVDHIMCCGSRVSSGVLSPVVSAAVDRLGPFRANHPPTRSARS